MEGVRRLVEHQSVGETNWDYQVGKALRWSKETSREKRVLGYGILNYYRPAILIMLKVGLGKRLTRQQEKQDLVFTRSYVDDVVEVLRKQSMEEKAEENRLEEMIQALQKLTLPGKDSKVTEQESPEKDVDKEQGISEVSPEAELMRKERILDVEDNGELTIATEECTRENEHLEASLTAPNQDENIQRTNAKESLFETWMEFVYSERIQEGLYGRLVKTNQGWCECGKGRMSFPHWPPTSLNEAETLFENCLNNENTHRKYLARSWWAFVARIAAVEPWKQQVKKEIYVQKEREIREACEIRFDEEITITRRRRKADCQGICEPTLKKQKYACLCDCGHHREECPVHQKNL
jgi:hypothetical protein